MPTFKHLFDTWAFTDAPDESKGMSIYSDEDMDDFMLHREGRRPGASKKDEASLFQQDATDDFMFYRGNGNRAQGAEQA
ncbi:unnamed protein product [Aphanomyces euteiches]|uniref:Uncharacterized protein n=1 Tax=Aphanomyces euteiches TaxID=100861 RepID=A0A6G0XJT0_9STRA|nr:hypothetical protein Ae201684_004128 [Aphanomyces euteiches]KAH9093656.1 hypothetical protein Ae201684P_016282 [Aphanomyces euteiches]KAH9143340.1 hypothetical protein AeRB84_012657 [Aphanomyces euteiches]